MPSALRAVVPRDVGQLPLLMPERHLVRLPVLQDVQHEEMARV